MSLRKLLCAAALATLVVAGYGQAIPPMDHIKVDDPRLFDLSNDGPAYNLADGTITTATLSVVQGPNGKLTGVGNITNIYGASFGPVTLKGKVFVTSLSPLIMSMKGSAPGGIRMMVTGTYDVAPKLMNVIVIVKIQGTTYQWNDSFVPDHADETGITLDRSTVASNKNGQIKGLHTISFPGSPPFEVQVLDRQKPATTDFELRGTGSTIVGTFTNPDDVFVVLSATMNCSYGRIITAGANVTISTDNGFPREL